MRFLEADGSIHNPPVVFQTNQTKLLGIFPKNANAEPFHVILPQGLNTIEAYVLSNCSAFVSVAIPEGATIRQAAFRDSKIVIVTIPVGVTTIQACTFQYCGSLVSVTIPEGVTTIGVSAFKGCTSLASVTIPVGVTTIEVSAFDGCTSLAFVTIPEGVTTIGDEAFKGCSSLVSVEIPEGVTTIGVSAFRGCTSLVSVTIPRGVTMIKNDAFEDCSSLATATIPEGVTSIEFNAFFGCGELDGVIIPRSCNLIRENAFSNCPKLSLVVAPDALEVHKWHGSSRQMAYVRRGNRWVPSGSIAAVFPECPLLSPPAFVTPYTPAAIIAAQRLEYWAPLLHKRCSGQRREWVRHALIILTRQLKLPHFVAVMVLQHVPRAQLGRPLHACTL